MMKIKNVIILIIIIVIINIVVTRYIISKNSSYDTSKVLEVLSNENQEIAQDFFNRDSTRIAKNELLTLKRNNYITRTIDSVRNSVVSINVIKTEIIKTSSLNSFFFDDFFRGFFPRLYERKVKNLGSGVIISEDGYVLTNNHVVRNATEIKVILPDGRSFDGELVGSDNINDISLIKIKESETKLPFAKLGDSDDLIIGEWVIAMGNPFGFLLKDSQPTVTVGVISAVGRNFHTKDNRVYKKMIQTDAAINPGNSGGPLVNIEGEIIGINTFIFSKSGGNLGIGFAIPINRVKKITEEIIKYGKIRTTWFGFKVQDISPAIAHNMGLNSTEGVIISYIEKNSPAVEADLKRGDIIIQINNNIIKDTDDAEIAVSDIRVGEELTIHLRRKGEELIKKLVTKEYKEKTGSFFKL